MIILIVVSQSHTLTAKHCYRVSINRMFVAEITYRPCGNEPDLPPAAKLLDHPEAEYLMQQLPSTTRCRPFTDRAF